MYRLANIALLALAGCATTIYSPQTGKPLARIQSDATNVTFTAPGVTFHADRLSNSVPTRAAGRIITGLADDAAVLIPGGVLPRAVVGGAPILRDLTAKPGSGL